jgi:putative hemolysin
VFSLLKLPRIARDISYSYSAQTKAGKTVIKLMENTTGRLRLIKRARGYEQEVANGRDFWQVMVERYGLSLDIVAGDLSKIPTSGPLIMIANHPYGILDGLMMGHILSSVRGDFRILANTVFRKSADLQRVVLPISFDETKDAVREKSGHSKKRFSVSCRRGRNWCFSRWYGFDSRNAFRAAHGSGLEIVYSAHDQQV